MVIHISQVGRNPFRQNLGLHRGKYTRFPGNVKTCCICGHEDVCLGVLPFRFQSLDQLIGTRLHYVHFYASLLGKLGVESVIGLIMPVRIKRNFRRLKQVAAERNKEKCQEQYSFAHSKW